MLKNKKCPLCRDLIDKSDNNENKNLNNESNNERLSELIWEIQTINYPEFINYTYDNLWIEKNDNINYNNNDNCNNDFDCDCGGGATVNW